MCKCVPKKKKKRHIETNLLDYLQLNIYCFALSFLRTFICREVREALAYHFKNIKRDRFLLKRINDVQRKVKQRQRQIRLSPFICKLCILCLVSTSLLIIIRNIIIEYNNVVAKE